MGPSYWEVFSFPGMASIGTGAQRPSIRFGSFDRVHGTKCDCGCGVIGTHCRNSVISNSWGKVILVVRGRLLAQEIANVLH